MYVCMYVCMYVFMYVCVCMYVSMYVACPSLPGWSSTVWSCFGLETSMGWSLEWGSPAVAYASTRDEHISQRFPGKVGGVMRCGQKVWLMEEHYRIKRTHIRGGRGNCAIKLCHPQPMQKS